MTPYVSSRINASEQALFDLVCMAISQLSDIDLGAKPSGEKICLSCHILARATAHVFELEYVDGHFYGCFNHSWLLTTSGHIIDVYPVGALGGPILWDELVGKRLYKKTQEGYYDFFEEQWFKSATERVVTELQTISRTLMAAT
jgi:hypothetical protein